jgi:hypothetical protein
MSWRNVMRVLDRPRDAKRALYRVHRLAGLLLFAGALYTLDRLWFQLEPGAFGRIFAGWAEGELRLVLAEAFHLFLLGGNVLALAVALVVIFRPSLLKRVERWADRFYGARHIS